MEDILKFFENDHNLPKYLIRCQRAEDWILIPIDLRLKLLISLARNKS